MRHLRVLIVLAGLTSGVVVQSSECPEDRRPMSQRVAELSEVYSVFAGRAVNVKPLDRGLFETDFLVDKSWRGVHSSHVTVRSNISVLGPAFEPGQDYLVFAYRTSSSVSWLQADGCSTTTKLADAGPWLEVLGQARYVRPGESERPPR